MDSNLYRSLPHMLRRLFAAYTQYGVKPPKVAAELDELITVAETIERTRFAPEPLDVVVATSIREGRDPVDDPAVLRSIVASHLAGLTGAGALGSAARAEVAGVAKVAVDDLIEPLQAPFAEAGAKFTAAHTVLTAAGITGLRDRVLATASLPVATAGVEARTAEATMRTIAEATAQVLMQLDLWDATPIGVRVRTVDTGDAGSTAILRALPATGHDAWAAANAGYTHSLATPTEQAERYARVYQRDEELVAEAASLARQARARVSLL